MLKCYVMTLLLCEENKGGGRHFPRPLFMSDYRNLLALFISSLVYYFPDLNASQRRLRLIVMAMAPVITAQASTFTLEGCLHEPAGACGEDFIHHVMLSSPLLHLFNFYPRSATTP